MNHYLEIPPADFVAIVDALHRFGAGQDLHDRQLFTSAFAPGAILDSVQPAARLGVSLPVFQGRTAIVGAIMASTADLDTTHTVTNPRVTAYDGEHATLFALVEAQHLPRGSHRRHLLLKSFYFAQVARSGSRWVIEHLRIENVWLMGDPTVLFPTATAA